MSDTSANHDDKFIWDDGDLIFLDDEDDEMSSTEDSDAK